MNLVEYLHLTQHENTCREHVFTLGFTRKINQSPDSFHTLIKRRLIAILQAVCFTIGIETGLGHRKLHAFRFLCSNELDSKARPHMSVSCISARPLELLTNIMLTNIADRETHNWIQVPRLETTTYTFKPCDLRRVIASHHTVTTESECCPVLVGITDSHCH